MNNLLKHRLAKKKKMTMNKQQLKLIIIEEINKLIEEDSGFLSNIYKLCAKDEKCAPESVKTKWWKGK